MSEYLKTDRKKITTSRLRSMKAEGEKISMITCYDYSMARLLDNAGIDVILVGDSASNVMMGQATTLPITVDEMIVYGSSVVRGIERAMVVIDMPFGSYQVTPADAARNAVRIMRETGADCVKLEGGVEIKDAIANIIACGIPIMAHLGLTPQSIHQFGGYGVRARSEAEAELLLKNAHLVEDLGCSSLVLEKVPAELAKRVADELSIPVIGIGAGGGVDGQVLVLQDMLGITQGFAPKFLRKYANIGEQIETAVENYIGDVKSGDFPNEEESYL